MVEAVVPPVEIGQVTLELRQLPLLIRVADELLVESGVALTAWFDRVESVKLQDAMDALYQGDVEADEPVFVEARP